MPDLSNTHAPHSSKGRNRAPAGAAPGALRRVAGLSLLLIALAGGCTWGAESPSPTVPPPPSTPTPAGPAIPPTPGPAATATAPVLTVAPPPPSPTPIPSPTVPAIPTAILPPAIAGDLPRFGVDGGTSRQSIAAMRAGSIQMERVAIPWSAIEPENRQPAQFNWKVYDTKFATLAAAGIQPIALLLSCPAWACTDYSGPLDKVGPERFAAFAEAAATRYSRAPYNVHYWEIFNEPDTTNPPNHQGAWGLHGDQYAALLRATTPRLRAADPRARVLLGGLGAEWFMDEQPPGPFNRAFLHDVIAAGGAPYFDYLNFHYYPQNPHFPRLADKTAALLAQARAQGIDKPILCTEVGLTSSPDPRWKAPGWPANSEEVQARFLVRTFVEGFAAGLTSVAWFTLQDYSDPNPALQIFVDTGLIRTDASSKPAWRAFRTLAQQIGDRPFLRHLDAAVLGGAGWDGDAFGQAGAPLWVVWTRGDQPAPFVPPGRTILRAVDIYGAPVTLQGGAGTVGADPVYVTFAP